MGLARELERRLERLVDGATAAVFRGKMHPVDMAEHLVRQVDFMQVVGLVPGAGPQYSTAPLTYMSRQMGEEGTYYFNHGVDDDSDGFMDERELVRITPDGTETVIATYVKGWDAATSSHDSDVAL